MTTEEARDCVRQLVRQTNLRETARMIGTGREQVRRFASGEIRTPHARTLAGIERVFLAQKAEPRTLCIGLRSVLPEGYEAARDSIRTRLPPGDPLRLWLLIQVSREYAVDEPKLRRRANGSGEAP